MANSSLSAADMNIYDSEYLIEELSKQRVRSAQQQKEKLLLQTEIGELEEKTAMLKQQYNILSALEEVNAAQGMTNQENYDSSNGNGNAGGEISLSDSKFQLLNRKIETQILVSEIKRVLPSLESALAELEARIVPMEKSVRAAG